MTAKSDTIRYGIIGSGMMGIEHIENIKAIDGAVVSAIADPHEPSQTSALAAIGAQTGFDGGQVTVFDNHRALLNSDSCDVVVVASPNMTHHEVLLDVVETEFPVLVEKPLCTTTAHCQEIIDAAAERTAIIWTGLEYRYMPPVARLLELVGTGATGSINMVAIREHRFPFLTKVGDWNRFSRNTGGTLVEKCCHFFDLMNVVTQAKPVSVMASGGQDVNHLDECYDGERSDILDNAYVIVNYDNGARAMLDLCMFAEATFNQEEISVVGDKGKVEAFVPENIVRVGERGKHNFGNVDVETIPTPPTSEIGYLGHHHGSSFVEHLRFLEAVRSGGEPEISLHDGMLSVAIGEAAHVSIDQARQVALSEVLPG